MSAYWPTLSSLEPCVISCGNCEQDLKGQKFECWTTFVPNILSRSDSLVYSLCRYAINTGVVTRWVLFLLRFAFPNVLSCTLSAVSISTLVLVSRRNPMLFRSSDSFYQYNVEAHSFIFVATYFALNKSEWSLGWTLLLLTSFSSVCYFAHGYVRYPPVILVFPALDSGEKRLNTRRIVRGRGTDRQQPTISQNIDNPINTNTFYLGTRVPSVGSITDIGDFDLEHLKVRFISSSRTTSHADVWDQFAPPECPIPPSQRESAFVTWYLLKLKFMGEIFRSGLACHVDGTMYKNCNGGVDDWVTYCRLLKIEWVWAGARKYLM